MSLLTEEVRSYIGYEGQRFVACDVTEAGAVRRYAQAIMDHDQRYSPENESQVAPLLYPVYAFRTSFEDRDALTERASDPDFDGLVPGAGNGLPELPLRGLSLLNGGADVEFYQFASVGGRIYQQSTYADIQERQSKSGAMLLVIVETLYSNQNGEPLLRYRKTLIRR